MDEQPAPGPPIASPDGFHSAGIAPFSAKETSTSNLPSPGINIEFHGDARPAPFSNLSAPVTPMYHSPARQHKRTASAQRNVKETLNARSEYTNEEMDGRSYHRINQYVIKEEIGRGSYGAVHRAVDQFGTEYAVKEFSKARLRKRAQSNILRIGPGRMPLRPGMGLRGQTSSRLHDQQAREAQDALFLIREEIAIMKKLHHENLVQLIEVLDDPEEDSLYMVLEMCKKGVIMKVGLDEPADPYPVEDCRCWFRDLILGIEYLHSQGIVHRDIKPDNLLLMEDDVLKIVDFGVSEIFEKPSEMRTAKSAGSPAFLPPELCVAAHGDVEGRAADIWSMGVTLYCLKYGRIPFERTGVLEMYEAIKTETITTPSNEDRTFVDLMSKLLEKDPAKRIKMTELREHPWVTKNGDDPLLSEEENCAEQVLLPNALEVNHAFTRKMSHLLCVMKAISRFKGLLNEKKKRKPADDSNAATPTQSQQHEDDSSQSEDKKHAAEYARHFLEKRKEFLKAFPKGEHHDVSKSGEKGHAHDLSENEAPFLGIGTGGSDDFSRFRAKHRHREVVADSPTNVDFNVYDRAFEEEVEKIKRSSSRRNSTHQGMYMTKHLVEKAKYHTDEMITWIGSSGHSKAGPPRTGPSVVDVVMQTVKETKDKAQDSVMRTIDDGKSKIHEVKDKKSKDSVLKTLVDGGKSKIQEGRDKIQDAKSKMAG